MRSASIQLPAVAGVKFEHIPGGYAVEWQPPVKGHCYVAGVDTSEGRSGCNHNGVGIIDWETYEQVWSCHGLFPPDQLAKLAVAACQRYNGALCGVERENHGHAVIQRVFDLGYYGENWQLFYHRPGIAGYSTNSATRPIMLEELANAIHPPGDQRGMVVNDRQLLSEGLTFNKQKDGSFSADPGAMDDCVMKWAIAVQMRKFYRPADNAIRLLAL